MNAIFKRNELSQVRVKIVDSKRSKKTNIITVTETLGFKFPRHFVLQKPWLNNYQYTIIFSFRWLGMFKLFTDNFPIPFALIWPQLQVGPHLRWKTRLARAYSFNILSTTYIARGFYDYLYINWSLEFKWEELREQFLPFPHLCSPCPPDADPRLLS